MPFFFLSFFFFAMVRTPFRRPDRVVGSLGRVCGDAVDPSQPSVDVSVNESLTRVGVGYAAAVADSISRKRLARLVHALQNEADPLRRLDAVRESLSALQELEASTVADARAAGRTWGEIGALYGLSKQGAQQRFRAPRMPGPEV